MQRWVGLHQARRSREKKKDIRLPYAAESVSQVLSGLVFNYNILSTEKPMPEARRRLKETDAPACEWDYMVSFVVIVFDGTELIDSACVGFFNSRTRG